MGSVWNPEQYHKFQGERSQPFFDLLSLVQPLAGGSAIDLGCGTGELTEVLHHTTGASSTLGIDSSESMIAGSPDGAPTGLSFELQDIRELSAGGSYDLVFSNAALQWIDDHEALFPRLCGTVAAGGQLAVQMPANDDHPSHRTAFELSAREPWRTVLGGYSRVWPVLPPERYAAILHAAGFTEQHVRLQVYPHSLESRASVVEWVRGTLLTDYQRRMNEDEFGRFLEAYRESLLPQLEDMKPFFYPFKRVLIWGRKTSAG